MSSIGKRWIAIIVGFAFLVISNIIDRVSENIDLRIVLNTVCIIGALLSFAISIYSDEQLKIEKLKKNKWIKFSVVLSIIILILVIISVVL